MNMKRMMLAAGSAILLWSAVSFASPIYLDVNAPLEQRVEDALSRMTRDEKIAIIHAQSKFCSPGVKRLGIPDVWATDGPHGIRPEVMWDEWEQAGWTNDSCVAFPALTCLAATWNPSLSAEYGNAIGEEARFRKKNILLGPGVNIYRTPLNGRNFEYMGEDPYLASRMVVPYIKGVQKNGVATCVKHFALNNHEINRHTTNVIIDDRTLHELYLPAFKAAVQEGGTWTIMAAYNLYKDQHLCHNQYMLNDILKKDWGFDGVVVSDWGGTHNTGEAVRNGLDLEFGSWTDGLSNGASNAYDNYYLANPYKELIDSGEVGTEELNDKARRVLRMIFRTSMGGHSGFGSLCSEEHYDVARRIGDEGIVLLKNNEGVLPVELEFNPRILVVGENAIKMMTVGGGSSSLKVQRELSPLDGIRKAVGSNGEVIYCRGYVGDVTGEYNGVVTGQDLSDSRSEDELIAEAIEEAGKADAVIFVGGLNKSAGQDCEDSDREGLELPYAQNRLIEALSKANKNLVVVNISGNAVAMPWCEKVPAILQGWYLGSEAGNSLADVIFGKVNPSGKLPFTFPVKLTDVAAHSGGKNYLGKKRDNLDIWDAEYSDGIFVGYRHHDTHGVRPLFPFGHGLSYTTFKYGRPSLSSGIMTAEDKIEVKVPVTNTGKRAGAETVQLYISDVKSSLKRPKKELKGFEKIYIQPGETVVATFSIDKSALSFYDPQKKEWVAEPGKFEVLIGSSSADIRSKAQFELIKEM
ncbi:MAG: glycoside hydrolase family 3 C-terminal domain-containing protein [Muribaculaceae bacterium]|nr:glycoside hydrolase family 3 C-terminal domain-containing protein [Muribaculaceae bacterium]